MKLQLAAALCAIGVGGCTSIVLTPLSHTSHLDRGWPLNNKPEWALDITELCGKRNYGAWFTEACAAYVWNANEPQRNIVSVRISREIPLSRAEH